MFFMYFQIYVGCVDVRGLQINRCIIHVFVLGVSSLYIKTGQLLHTVHVLILQFQEKFLEKMSFFCGTVTLSSLTLMQVLISLTFCKSSLLWVVTCIILCTFFNLSLQIANTCKLCIINYLRFLTFNGFNNMKPV